MSLEMKTADIDIRDAFFDEVYKLAARDKNVIFLTADMGAFSLNRFKADLKDQYINVGVAEQNLVGIAAGLALAGKKVFIYTIAPFITQRCYEQIKVDLCGMKLPVTLVGVGGGITYGSDGPTHHAIQDVAVMRVLPEITILNPSDAVMATAAARIAGDAKGPLYVRIDKGKLPRLYDDKADFSSGLALLKKGGALVIIGTGILVARAMEVAEELSRQGIDAGVIDLYRLKPVNEKLLIAWLKETRRAVTLEEGHVTGGVGSIVSEVMADHQLFMPLKRIGIEEESYARACYGDREWMQSHLGLDAAGIGRSILEWVKAGAAPARPDAAARLNPEDLAGLFGTTVDDLGEECRRLIAGMDLRYTPLSAEETEKTVLGCLKTVESGSLSRAGANRKPVWENGWSENLRDFIASGYDLDKLLPKFLKNNVMRLTGGYVMPASPDFETSLVTVQRCYLFRKYFADAREVYEFGCGTGLNLVALAGLFPAKKLQGLDWSKTAIEIVNKIAETKRLNISGRLFDMFAPDYSLDVPPGSAAFTIGALEQLGTDFEPFLRFLLDKKFAVCVNIETIYELYDQDRLFDYVAAKYLEKRGYLRGYLTRVRSLESEGKIDIIKTKRGFGSLYHDGYSFIVWRSRQ